MDAIECGIVKLPRVPVADNLRCRPTLPIYPQPVGAHRQGHAEEGPRQRRQARPAQPARRCCRPRSTRSTATTRRRSSSGSAPGSACRRCFIVVCNNTATSKLVYEWISGFERDERRRRARRLHTAGISSCSATTTSTATALAAPAHAADRPRAARIRRRARQGLPRRWPAARSSSSSARWSEREGAARRAGRHQRRATCCAR